MTPDPHVEPDAEPDAAEPALVEPVLLLAEVGTQAVTVVDEDEPGATDGRQRRRERNREAVVEALLDLYRDGNLGPSTEEIAQRSGLSPRSLFRYFDDVDDLVRVAIAKQTARALPLVDITADREAPLDQRAAALVDQRFRLFGAVATAATMSRLRAPFQPLLQAQLTQNRLLLRGQLGELFAPELETMDNATRTRTLAVADVLTSFESHQLLMVDQGLDTNEAEAAMSRALTLLLAAPR